MTSDGLLGWIHLLFRYSSTGSMVAYGIKLVTTQILLVGVPGFILVVVDLHVIQDTILVVNATLDEYAIEHWHGHHVPSAPHQWRHVNPVVVVDIKISHVTETLPPLCIDIKVSTASKYIIFAFLNKCSMPVPSLWVIKWFSFSYIKIPSPSFKILLADWIV